jgi:hypothetical protein
MPPAGWGLLCALRGTRTPTELLRAVCMCVWLAHTTHADGSLSARTPLTLTPAVRVGASTQRVLRCEVLATSAASGPRPEQHRRHACIARVSQSVGCRQPPPRSPRAGTGLAGVPEKVLASRSVPRPARGIDGTTGGTQAHPRGRATGRREGPFPGTRVCVVCEWWHTLTG